MTIQDAIERYLKQVKRSKSSNTTVAYQQGLKAFAECMAESDEAINFEQVDIETLSPLWIETFLNQLQKQSVATEHLYTTAAAGFYRYVAAQEWATLNLSTLDFELGQRRSQGKRLHIFPEENLETLLTHMEEAITRAPKSITQKLTLYRDTALLITLADTGLRVSEACGLQKGDLDWDHRRAVIIGKGDKQAIVRFSQRSLRYISNYLSLRSELDQKQGRQNVLPIFARHDKRVSKKVLPISSRTAENIVTDYVIKFLGEEARGTITPHTFRHYFVTRVARQHDILVAQNLARHESINTTSGYTHLTETEIDQAYAAVFGQERSDQDDNA
ncbi:MAG: tyrosine-type recombinase/integrase [Anaerolineae bacterium]|nr:tyrosine-type recombinase/integrase [Anaerolineae bacterium]